MQTYFQTKLHIDIFGDLPTVYIMLPHMYQLCFSLSLSLSLSPHWLQVHAELLATQHAAWVTFVKEYLLSAFVISPAQSSRIVVTTFMKFALLMVRKLITPHPYEMKCLLAWLIP